MQRSRPIKLFPNCLELQNLSREFKPDVHRIEKYVIVMITYLEASGLNFSNACADYHLYDAPTLQRVVTGTAIPEAIKRISSAIKNIQEVEEGTKEVNRIHFLFLTRPSNVEKYDTQMMHRIGIFATDILGKMPKYALEWEARLSFEDFGALDYDLWT